MLASDTLIEVVLGWLDCLSRDAPSCPEAFRVPRVGVTPLITSGLDGLGFGRSQITSSSTKSHREAKKQGTPKLKHYLIPPHAFQ